MEQSCPTNSEKGMEEDYALIGDGEDRLLGLYDKPLSCFGCGIGWFCFLLGFVFPFMWYYATFLYFRNYYRKALVFTVVALIIVAVILFQCMIYT